MKMQNLMAQAQKMQKDIMKKKEELNNQEFIGKSQWVEVTFNGDKKLLKVNITTDVQIDDKEMLEDMIKIAIDDAMKKIDDKTEEVMGVYGNSLNGLF